MIIFKIFASTAAPNHADRTRFFRGLSNQRKMVFVLLLDYYLLLNKKHSPHRNKNKSMKISHFEIFHTNAYSQFGIFGMHIWHSCVKRVPQRLPETAAPPSC
jgi:hypothetical protein